VKAALIGLAMVVFTAAASAGQLVDISYDARNPRKRQAVKFQAMDVLLIEVTNGPRAVVQFTDVGRRHGTYRWRCRRSGSATVTDGKGTVAEKLEEIPDDSKRGHMLPLPGHDPIVRVDEIRAAWSWADDRSAYLYFQPRRATVKILPAASYDKEP
jgi:hypothetical protein